MKASLQIADDLVRNLRAVSKYGYRHDEIFQAISVLIFNQCQAALVLLSDNLPEILLSPSPCAQIRKQNGIDMDPLPGVDSRRNIKEHFQNHG